MKKITVIGILIIFMLMATSFTIGFQVRELSNENSHRFFLEGWIDGIGNVTITGVLEVEPVMATVVINSDADDGYLYEVSAVSFNDAWTAASSTYAINNTITNNCGLGKTAGNYYIFRTCLFFDTSSIPSNVIINSAKLTFVLYRDISTIDFDVVVQNGQPTYPSKPIVVTDYDKDFYSGDGGSINTSDLPAVNNPFDINLNPTGWSWINKGGMTKLILRSSNDIAGVGPTGLDYVVFYSFEKGTIYIPKLTVTYHTGYKYPYSVMNG